MHNPVTEEELKLLLKTCRSLLGQCRNVTLALSIRLIPTNSSPDDRVKNDSDAKALKSDLLNLELSVRNVEVVLLNACNMGAQISLIFPDKSRSWEIIHKLQRAMDQINMRCAVINGKTKHLLNNRSACGHQY